MGEFCLDIGGIILWVLRRELAVCQRGHGLGVIPKESFRIKIDKQSTVIRPEPFMEWLIATSFNGVGEFGGNQGIINPL